MIRPILKYGDITLHERAEPVAEITPEIDRMIDDMIQTMYAAPGIGLAATQIGVPLRIFVIDLSVGQDPSGLLTMINPEFVERDGMQLEEEGCLSVPGLARAFQHEMDHLEGALFVDRLRGIKRDLIVRKIRKLARSGKW